VHENSPQDKITILIGQLEGEVRKLCDLHEIDLRAIRESSTSSLQRQSEYFENQLSTLNSKHRTQIAELETEIEYLKELNLAQRLMMEDNLGYIKRLEEKLEAMRSVN
jgi:hypothetical protein